jgi:hypothetical protein
VKKTGDRGERRERPPQDRGERRERPARSERPASEGNRPKTRPWEE